MDLLRSGPRGPASLGYRQLGLVAGLVLALVAPVSAGIVVEGEARRLDGTPFPGAQVELSRYPERAALATALLFHRDKQIVAVTGTDATGHFRLAASTGLWSLALSAPGHVTLELDLVPLLEDQVLDPVALEPAEAVALRVVDPTGRKVPGAMMRVDAERGSSAWLHVAPWRPQRGVLQSDAEGLLRISRRAGEALAVTLFAPGYREKTLTLPGADRAVLIRALGEPREVLVVERAEAAASGVVIHAGSGQGWPVALTDADGRARLPPGLPQPLVLVASGGRRVEITSSEAASDRFIMPPPVELAGEVRRRGTGEPLRDAVVWLADDPGVWSLADQRGSYVLTLADSGALVLKAAAAGHFPGRLLASGPERAGGSGEPQRRAPHIVLAPMANLSGRVEDTSGLLIAGASIAASARQDRDVVGRVDGAGVQLSGVSARDGRFRLRGLVTGALYDLRVAAAGFAPQHLEIVLGESGAPEPNLLVALGRGESVRGRVVGPDGAPVAAAVHLVPANDLQQRLLAMYGDPRRAQGHEIMSSAADGDGSFELRGLPAGRYDLVAAAPGLAPETMLLLEVTEGEAPRDIGTLSLGPGATLAGVVQDAWGKPLSGARVSANAVRQTSSADGFGSYGHGVGQQLTDGSGRFRISGLVPGERVDLEIRLAGFVPALVRGVTTPPPEPLEVNLRPSAAAHGRVIAADGRALAGARVELEPAGQPVEPEGMADLITVSDAEGAFTLRDLQPGEARLIASARGYVQRTLDLVLVSGEELSSLEVVLKPGLTVEGRVLNGRGEPEPGALVRARGVPGVTTDSAGQYRLEGLPPGLAQLMAWHAELGGLEKEVLVESPGARADLRFSAGTTVAGTTVDIHGRPIAGVRLELASNRPGPPIARASGHHGSFRFEGVVPGRHELRADKEGFAPIRRSLQVGGEPIDDLTAVLSEGGAIVGRLLGLEPSELATARVSAQREGLPSLAGEVAADGAYRVRNADPGPWVVTATTGDRRARGTVEVAVSGQEARLDLELEKGAALVARIFVDGSPAAGAFVKVTPAHDGGVPTSARIGFMGDVRVSGLREGPHWLGITVPHLGWTTYSQKVQVAGDEELRIDLRTVALLAVVGDRETGSPLSGAVVRATPLLGSEDRIRLTARVFRCDSQGRTAGARLFQGAYYVEAEAPGYQPAASLATLTGPEPTTLVLSLERSPD